MLAQVERSEAVGVVDGPFFGVWEGAGLEDVLGGLLEVFGVLGGVDPWAVESPVGVVGE